MSAAELIPLIRDLIIIVASAVAIVVFLEVGYILLRLYLQLYPTLRRTAQNLEQSSNIIFSIVSQPWNLVAAVIELVNRVLGVVEQFRSKERRNDDDEDQ